MHIFGSVSDDGQVFNFEHGLRSDNTDSLNNDFTHSDNKIFIYIDGNISKLSDEIIELTSKYQLISKKFLIFTILDLILKIISVDLLISFYSIIVVKNLD